MACCGDRRRSLSQPPARATPAPAPVVRTQNVASRQPPIQQPPIQQPQRQTQAAIAPILLRYSGNTNAVFAGPVTGRRYAFSGRGSMQSVDARDAVQLLRRQDFDKG